MGSSLKKLIHHNLLVAAQRVVHPNVPNAVTAEVGGWMLVDAGRKAMPFLNGASPVSTQRTAPVSAVEDWFTRRDAKPLFRLMRDVHRNLIHALMSDGYEVSRTEPTLILEKTRTSDSDGPLRVVSVRSSEELKPVVRRAGQTDFLGEFGLSMSEKTLTIPGASEEWGFIENELIAGAVTVITPPLAGIYAVGVKEEHRRRGFGTAITKAAINTALQNGAKTIWLGTSEMALPMYLKMGFEQIGEYDMLSKPDAGRRQAD